MSTSDGTVVGATTLIDNGTGRWNLVLVGDGYQQSELSTFATDAQSFCDRLLATEPFDGLQSSINVYRIDVASTGSGAKDPSACGGSGASPATYCDSSFCTNGIQRLLVVNTDTVRALAYAQVPTWNMIVVIVNSTTYGGSGGAVAVYSRAANADEIGIHEMGHTAFGLADEYEYYAGCGSGETGHDSYGGAEPAQSNITKNADRSTIKWASLVDAATPMPTTSNPDCSTCDGQASPVSSGTVGAFEGAFYHHCGAYRPAFECRMRTLGNPFCPVCQARIRQVLAPFTPAHSEPGDFPIPDTETAVV
jgi:hypothetical protein